MVMEVFVLFDFWHCFQAKKGVAICGERIECDCDF